MLKYRVFDGEYDDLIELNITVLPTNLQPPIFEELQYFNNEVVEHQDLQEPRFLIQVSPTHS